MAVVEVRAQLTPKELLEAINWIHWNWMRLRKAFYRCRRSGEPASLKAKKNYCD